MFCTMKLGIFLCNLTLESTVRVSALNIIFQYHMPLAFIILSKMGLLSSESENPLYIKRMCLGTLVPFCVIGNSKEFPITQKSGPPLLEVRHMSYPDSIKS